MEENSPQQVQNSATPQPVPSAAPLENLNIDSYEKAGFILRGAAYMLDSFLLVIPLIFFTIIFPNLDENILNGFLGFVLLIYFIVATGLYGATLGKKFFYLRVVRMGGGKIGLGKAFIREFLGKLVSSLILNLGFFWVIWDKEKQGWHDKIAKTYVISEKPIGKGRKTLAYFIIFLLPVIAILGIIAVVVLVSINPTRQLEKARDAAEQEKQRLEQNLPENLYPTDLPTN